MKDGYKKEFFDRSYTWKEAYSRLWKYIRPYRVRLIIGIVSGLLTAGTLVPVFQMVQPAVGGIEMVGRVQNIVEKSSEITSTNEDEKISVATNNLPSWYPKVEKLARRFGITIMDESGALQGPVILLALIVVPFVALVRLGLRFLNHYMLSWVGARATMDLSCDLMSHVQRQSLEFYARTDVGQVMSRISGDPREIRTVIHSVISDLAESPFEIFVSVAFVVWHAFKNDMLPTLVILAVAFPLFTISLKAIGTRIRNWSQRSMERASRVLSRIHEVLTCIKFVKSANTEKFENDNYSKANSFLVKSILRSVRLGGIVPVVMELTGVLLLCGFVCWCFVKHITLDQVLPMMAPLLVIYKPVKKLSRIQVTLETSMASLCRIFSLLDVKMELPESSSLVRKNSFNDKICFDNVSYRYTTQDRDAVHNVSFEIKRGQKVAVVGGTGSGKSTLGSLLARFMDPTGGKIFIDGVDLKDIAIEDLRKFIGVVTQDALLFNDSIAYNIKYGSENATLEQIIDAAKIANAHDFIIEQPEGYERLCGEKGFALSGGERQRISIARAVLRNSPILILDEATSALDNVTERLVQDALERLMESRTTFVIAHRLSTIKDADLIFVMRDGQIVESGNHDTLYAKGGVYKALCDMQGE